jgi:large subunit ribosomal protein L4
MKKKTAKEEKRISIEGLNPKVFDGKINKAVLYQVIRMYEANMRQGTASSKTRDEVAGGGRKPWKQKGTGRARAGSIRSPLWKGGGNVFGPRPRDYSYILPQKIKREALKSSLNSKYNENDLMLVDDIKVDKPKTKEFKAVLNSLKLSEKTLFVLDKIDNNLRLASRNLQKVLLKRAEDLNARDVLASKKLVLTRPALAIIEKKLSGE